MSPSEPFPLCPRSSLAGLELPAGEIHLWCSSLDPAPSRIDELRRHLSADERTRAARFHFERDQRRYAVSRGLLRCLLAGYTGLPAARLRFVYGDKGKPSLAPGQGPGDLEFNVSHSGEQVLLGFVRGIPLGVDIEELRPMPDALDIGRRFFSASEWEVLGQMPPELVAQAFFNCWTRKEAYVKAVGDGLSIPLDRFDVSLAPGSPAHFLALDGDPDKAATWSLHHLDPVPGYVGAVALPSRGERLMAWKLELQTTHTAGNAY